MLLSHFLSGLQFLRITMWPWCPPGRILACFQWDHVTLTSVCFAVIVLHVFNFSSDRTGLKTESEQKMAKHCSVVPFAGNLMNVCSGTFDLPGFLECNQTSWIFFLPPQQKKNKTKQTLIITFINTAIHSGIWMSHVCFAWSQRKPRPILLNSGATCFSLSLYLHYNNHRDRSSLDNCLRLMLDDS